MRKYALVHCCWQQNLGQPSWRQAAPLQLIVTTEHSMYAPKWKHISTKACTQVCNIIYNGPSWEQLRYHINWHKMWYLHTMGDYSAVQRHEVLALPQTWALQIRMLSERSQSPKMAHGADSSVGDALLRQIRADREIDDHLGLKQTGNLGWKLNDLRLPCKIRMMC